MWWSHNHVVVFWLSRCTPPIKLNTLNVIIQNLNDDDIFLSYRFLLFSVLNNGLGVLKSKVRPTVSSSFLKYVYLDIGIHVAKTCGQTTFVFFGYYRFCHHRKLLFERISWLVTDSREQWASGITRRPFTLLPMSPSTIGRLSLEMSPPCCRSRGVVSRSLNQVFQSLW